MTYSIQTSATALICRLLRSAYRVEDPLSRNSQFALLISELAFELLICSHRKRMDRSAGEVSKGCPDGQGLPHPQARVGEPLVRGLLAGLSLSDIMRIAPQRTATPRRARAAMAAFARSWRRE